MRTISCWNDLEKYGIVILTSEACGLCYRILFDLTEQGKKIVEKCLGCQINSENWNGGSEKDPHVASILLSREMLTPIGVFALLESGCVEVLITEDELVGIEFFDPKEKVRSIKPLRRLSYRGTAGDRNVHVMSGRVQ